MWETVLLFLEENAAVLGSAGGVAGTAAVVWAIVKAPFRKEKPVQLTQDSIDQIKGPEAKDGPALTVPEFIRLRRELKADLEDELARASDAEKSQLLARIAELETQIANPDKALEEANKRIADLEALLDRSGNEIGGDRVNAAKAALEHGDYSLADDIFAEIEARNDLAVQESARAAYGRGEVAEAEIRWADAAKHYVTAAKRHETFDHIRKASEFLGRAGRYKDALIYSAQLVSFAEQNGTEEQLAIALNVYGLHLDATGAFSDAEEQFKKALAIGRATIGEDHPAYAIRLNNLAGVVEAQGRYGEAEGLFRDALAITGATIGEDHPDYATGLNNLAGVVEAQGRYTEAEGLYRDALAIDRTTIGEEHPSYAIHLSNLALVVKAQGRYGEAECLFRDALAIDRTTIGEEHPSYAIHLNNLAGVVGAQGRYGEAEGLYRDALAIGRATIGEGHPDYAIRLNNLAGVLVKLDRPEEARPPLEQALTIFKATLPADHPYIAGTQAGIANLPPPTAPPREEP